MLSPTSEEATPPSPERGALFPPSVEFDDVGPTVALLGSPAELIALEASLEHSPNHADCPACSARNRELQGVRINFAQLAFSEAAEHWMRLRRQSKILKPRTHETTLDYLRALEKFFSGVKLCNITPGHIRAYQLCRLHNALRTAAQEIQPWAQKAGHSRVNHEISALGQMLTHARLWQRIKPFYFPLQVKSWSPRTILSEEEEERLFQIAARHPEARLAYLVAAITNNTGASGIELRGLRLKHLFLPAEGIAEIYIPEEAVKNNARPRKIALNKTARWAVEECYRRALTIGSCEPEHYLFPFRIAPRRWDPVRAASRSFLRKSWQKLRLATGFKDIRPHDLRHHFATKLLESDVNIETARALLGHVSPRMTEYYAHQRKRVKYAAVCAIERKPPKSER